MSTTYVKILKTHPLQRHIISGREDAELLQALEGCSIRKDIEILPSPHGFIVNALWCDAETFDQGIKSAFNPDSWTLT
jgi:hypothetical protein